MGRPKGSTNSYKPFRATRDGVEYGSYRVWDRAKKQVVSLDTQDLTEALTRAAGLTGRVPNERISEPRNVPERDESPGASFPGGDAGGVPAGRILADWATLGNAPTIPEATQVPKPESGVSGTADATTQLRVINGGAENGNASRAKTKKGSLTPEQAEKLGRGLTKIVTKLNAVGAEMCVRMLGKDPYPLDEEDFELIELGWELFIAEHFGKTQPKPWHLILAGNCMILFAMYVRGTPIVKEPDGNAPLPPA